MAVPHCTGSLWILQLPHSPSFSPTSLVVGCSLSLVFLLFTSRQDRRISFLIPFWFADILQINYFMTTGRDGWRHCCRVSSLFTLFISMFNILIHLVCIVCAACAVHAQARDHARVWHKCSTKGSQKLSVHCVEESFQKKWKSWWSVPCW